MKEIYDGIDNLTEAAARITPQWLAGFFDGEGSVTVGLRPGGQHFIAVGVSQHDLTLLTLIGLKFPGCNGPYPVSGRRTSFEIRWSGDAAGPFLEAIKDFVVLKRRQVELGIEFVRTIGRKGKPVSPETRKRREEIQARVRSMNDAQTGELKVN